MLVSIAAVVSGVDAGVTLLAKPVSVFTLMLSTRDLVADCAARSPSHLSRNWS